MDNRRKSKLGKLFIAIFGVIVGIATIAGVIHQFTDKKTTNKNEITIEGNKGGDVTITNSQIDSSCINTGTINYNDNNKK